MNQHNICGVLVMARPERAAIVEQALGKVAGVEVHAREASKLVVTVEDVPQCSCVDIVSSLVDIEGVVSTSIIYQHTDIEDPQQELAQ